MKIGSHILKGAIVVMLGTILWVPVTAETKGEQIKKEAQKAWSDIQETGRLIKEGMVDAGQQIQQGAKKAKEELKEAFSGAHQKDGPAEQSDKKATPK